MIGRGDAMTPAMLALLSLGVAVVWSGHPIIGGWLLVVTMIAFVALRFANALADHQRYRGIGAWLQCSRCRQYIRADDIVWIDHAPTCLTCRNGGLT